MRRGARRSADWMHHVDERILEHLAECGWLTPREFARNPKIDATEARVYERCLVLCHVGFAAPMVGGEPSDIADGVMMARLGEEYLAGKLDAQYHEPPPRTWRDLGDRYPAPLD